MHKVKQLWSQVIFREDVDPEAVLENRLSATEVKDGYLNLSNLDIPASCWRGEDTVAVVLINIHGTTEEPVLFRCHQRRMKGKRGRIYKRQRFWPIGFGLKEWFDGQHIGTGDLIMMAAAVHGRYLIFRAIRPKSLMMLHDRRSAERRALERRFDDRRSTLVHVSNERRKRDRRDAERRTLERRIRRKPA